MKRYFQSVILFLNEVHFYPIRPFRTKSGRSCCRTWSTSASGTWGSLSYQKKGETWPNSLLSKVRSYLNPQGDTHTHTNPLTCISGMQECHFSSFIGTDYLKQQNSFFFLLWSMCSNKYRWTFNHLILPAGGRLLSSGMECSTFLPLVGTAQERSELNSLKSTR